MTTRKEITNVLSTALVAIGLVGFSVGSASAESITINNGDFSADNGGDWTTVPEWNEGANSWTYSPNGNQLLYFGNTGKVDQDLGHNWSASDKYILSLTGHEMSWSGSGEAFSVQLRQTDGTVLWDSGSTSVDGVPMTAPQLFSWNIDAAGFTGGVPSQQLNIQLQCTAASAFLDDVTLDTVDTLPPSVGGEIFVETMTLGVTNEFVNIQWQKSTTGSTWDDIDGAKFSSLDITSLYTNTPLFRVEATSSTSAPAYSALMEISSENYVPSGTIILIR